MRLAENPLKVRNIVDGNFEEFRALYREPIERYSSATAAMAVDTRQIERTVAHSSRQQAVAGLLSVGPINALKYVWRKIRKRFGAE